VEITRAEIAAARDNSNVLAVLYFDTAAYLPLPVDARSTLCASRERWAATQSDLPVKIGRAATKLPASSQLVSALPAINQLRLSLTLHDGETRKAHRGAEGFNNYAISAACHCKPRLTCFASAPGARSQAFDFSNRSQSELRSGCATRSPTPDPLKPGSIKVIQLYGQV